MPAPVVTPPPTPEPVPMPDVVWQKAVLVALETLNQRLIAVEARLAGAEGSLATIVERMPADLGTGEPSGPSW